MSLDSVEPVILSGGASATSIPPSPAAMTSAKLADGQQGADNMQPRGEPQLVGLTQLTYQAGLLKIRDRGPQPCT